MDSIIVTVTLPGSTGGPVRHENRQKWTIALSEEFGSSMSKVIKHTDRKESECGRVFSVPSDSVNSWVKGDCPPWETPKDWKAKSPIQKLISHVLRFDDGYGVTFEFLGDGGE